MSELSLSLLHTTAERPALAVLMVCLLVASVTDLQRRRIPNWLTGPGILVGLTLHAALSGGMGLLSCLLSLGVWFALGFGFYVMVRGIGAGDIKLILVCATLVGFLPTLMVATLSFALQVAWLLARWIVLGVAVANLRALGQWLWVLMTPHTAKLAFTPVGTPDKSPHAPFLFLAALLIFGAYWGGYVQP